MKFRALGARQTITGKDLIIAMTPTSLIIVTDRGSLKAYKVAETPNRGPNLSLLRAFDTTEAHGRYQDKVTDQAGRFSTLNTTQGETAERQGLEEESERRIIRQLADNIAEVVKGAGLEGWSFAAPSSIHGAIVEQLPKEVRERVVEHVKSDLVKIEPSELPRHFRSLQPI